MRTTWFALLGLLLPASSFAVCGAETRTTVDSLTCEDPGAGSKYRINVNVMCGTLNGVEQTLVEVEEQRLRDDGTPSVSQQVAKIWKTKQAAEIVKAGKKEWKLWSQRAGKAGQLEAWAIPAADGKSVEKLRLKATPNAGDPCEKTVDIAEALKKDFSAAPGK